MTWKCPTCSREFKSASGHLRHCGTWEGWFWSLVDKRTPDECWLWVGQKDKNGYGRADRKGPNVYPHRVAWRLTHGADAGDMEVAHRCDVRNCCNPAHLFLATHDENMKDCAAKGRHRRGSMSSRAKLTEELVIAARRLRAEGMVYREISERLGHPVSMSVLINAVTGKKWKHVIPFGDKHE